MKYSDKVVEEVKELYRQGRSTREIAKLKGIGKSTIAGMTRGIERVSPVKRVEKVKAVKKVEKVKEVNQVKEVIYSPPLGAGSISLYDFGEWYTRNVKK